MSVCGRHLGFILADSKVSIAPTDVLGIIGSALYLVHGVARPGSSSLYKNMGTGATFCLDQQ